MIVSDSGMSTASPSCYPAIILKGQDLLQRYIIAQEIDQINIHRLSCARFLI